VGPNLLRDGGFELALGLNWTNPVSNGASTLSTAIKHSGNSSLHLISTNVVAGPGTAIYQDVVPGLTSGATYTLSFWYLAGTNNGPLVARVLNNLLSSVAFGSSNVALATPGTNNSLRASLPPFPKLWLNEILPNNVNGSTDRFGHRHPWVELYNSGTNAISLGGYFLANNSTNPTHWPFPANAVIAPDDFL